MRRHCVLCLLLLLFLVPVWNADAQTTNATISGVVVDPSGKIIPDTQIVIVDEATGVRYFSRTNENGIYTITILPPGGYRLEVSKQGFKTIIKPGIVLNVQSAVALNFTLPIGATSESVTVEAGGSIINTTDATVSTVIDRKFVENIPLNGRSFQDLISMTPGVVTQSPQTQYQQPGYSGDFSVNGQRTESNYYTVDGVSGNISAGIGSGAALDATGGTVGGSTSLGTTQSLISVDALQEFRVLSSTYSAEFGRSPGGQFSLATRSGTNRFRGSAFDYLRNDFFDANDWFDDHYAKAAPALRQNDFGGTLGGPVLLPLSPQFRDRTFFFVSYEGLRLTQPTAATVQYVPDSSMRQKAAPAMQPILNAFPVANGIDYGTNENPSLAQFILPYSSPSQIDSTSVRIDHTLSPRLSLFFRFGDTPTFTSSRPNFALSKTIVGSQTYTLGATSQFSNRLNNEFRIGYDRSDSTLEGTLDSFGGGSPTDLAASLGAEGSSASLPTIYFYINGIGSSELLSQQTMNRGRQWNVVDTASILHGNHQLKVGFDFRRIKSPLTPPNPEIFAEFLSPSSILNGIPDYPDIIQSIASTPLFSEFAAFAQDELRASSKLNLSMGIRWEVDPPPTEAHGDDAYTLRGNIAVPSSLTLAPQGTALWRTPWFNFAPRLGLAWIVRGDDSRYETVVRTGGGVFFDTVNQVGAAGYTGFGFEASNLPYGAQIPFTHDQIYFPISTSSPYTSGTADAFPEHLQLPYTIGWNTSVQQALGGAESLTVSYIGSNGRRLVGKQQLSLAKLNPNFGTIYYYPSGVTSNYQALEVQFQRTVVHGAQALASYTWSHSLDFGSSDTALPLERGNSDFDIRSNLQAGVSWDIPTPVHEGVAATLLNRWGSDLRVMARSAFPISLNGNQYFDPGTGAQEFSGLNVNPNLPIYLRGDSYAGGKIVNKAAFSVPRASTAGNAPRNFVRGFGMAQVNLAVRREFEIRDGFAMQFRAEAFNLLNHPNFGYVDPTYTDATFGQATKMLNSSLATLASQYQQGGPRSMQFALKVHF